MMEDVRGILPKGLYSFHPLVAKEAMGCRIRDIQGAEYLDLTSGLGVLPLGHNHPSVTEAVRGQLGRLSHMCVHVMAHSPYLALAHRLHDLILPHLGKKVVFFNSGAEAVENAVKIARHSTGKRAVVAFDGAYHGRTLLCTTLNGRARPYRTGYPPLAPDIYHIPYAYCYRCPWNRDPDGCACECSGALDHFFNYRVPPGEVAAVILEPIQGESGVIVPPEGFIRSVFDRCKAEDILIIVDEVQTGMGRTGAWLAIDHLRLDPDLVILGKALGGGLPLSAVMGRAQIMDASPPSSLGSTFGGNPVACTSAMATIQALDEEGMLNRAVQVGEKVHQTMQGWKGRFKTVGDVRGRGALWAVELVNATNGKEPDAALARKVTRLVRERGALVIRGGLYGNVIRVLPPLNIPFEELCKGLRAIEEALEEAETP